jgi:hypothetical protein
LAARLSTTVHRCTCPALQPGWDPVFNLLRFLSAPAVSELVGAIQAQGLHNIGTVWATQGPQATAAQLHQLGEANAAALFSQLGPDAIASLLRSCGPDFAPQLFVALGAPFAGGLLRHAGTDFSAGLFAALGIDFMVPMLQFMGAEYLSQMMNAAGPATAAGTFKVCDCGSSDACPCYTSTTKWSALSPDDGSCWHRAILYTGCSSHAAADAICPCVCMPTCCFAKRCLPVTGAAALDCLCVCRPLELPLLLRC